MTAARVLITESIGRPASCQIVSHRRIKSEIVGQYGNTKVFRMTCEDCGAGWQRMEERK